MQVGRKLLGWANAYRLAEAAMVTGLPLAGAALAWPGPQPGQAGLLALFGTGCAAAVLLVYGWNVHAGREADAHNPRLNAQLALPIWAMLGLGLVFLGCFGALVLVQGRPVQLLLLADALLLLGLFYSGPRGGLKRRPPWGTVAHAAMGLGNGVLGAMLFRGDATGGWAAGAWLGALFAGGHLAHEVMDLPADRQSNTPTGAQRWGARRGIWAALLLFGLAALWAAAGAAGLWPSAAEMPAPAAQPPVLVVLAAAGLVQGLLGVLALRGPEQALPQRVHRWRGQYRAVFALAATLAALWVGFNQVCRPC